MTLMEPTALVVGLLKKRLLRFMKQPLFYFCCMEKYISLIRGINVTGHRIIKMTELKQLYEDLGFQEVQTYIQSGNVIFKLDGESSCMELSSRIEKAIFEKFGYNVSVIIRTPEELAKVLNINPYCNADGTFKDNIYITFLEDYPTVENLEKIRPLSFHPDRFTILGKEVFIDCASGYGTTKLSNTFFENKLNVRATTRNWKTAVKLLEMAGIITDSE